MQRNPETLLILISIIILSFLVFKWQDPPEALPVDAAEEEFSSMRAMKHLEIVAAKPHAGGTAEHAKVREYLVNELKELGLEVSVREGTSVRRGTGYAFAGHTINIMGRLKGTEGDKTVLVMAHYDSQPNTHAAADDGSGVVSMLESIRAMKASGNELKNDVLFLITDLEEVGLMGAERFVYDSLELRDVGMILNFEARGNSGTPIVFEVSDGNGWLMREFSKAAPHPVANSLGYEIYKRMPNDTDVTMFKKTGITFLNSAFIEGYVNYHSMTDTPENIDKNTLQHQGANMLAMIQHFGNSDLNQTKDQDYVFFNPVGHWLVLYPVKMDMIFIILTLLLFLTCFVLGVKKGMIKLPDFALGFGLLLATIVVSIGFGLALKWILLKLYPYYEAFYSSNFYNAPYYYPVLIGLSLLAMGISFGWALKKFSIPSLVLGSLLVHMILLVVLKIYLSSGAYMIHFPIGLALIIFLGWILINPDEDLFNGRINFAMILPGLTLWLSLSYLILITFSIEMLAGPLVILSLITPFIIPIMVLCRRIFRPFFTSLALALFILGMGVAHFHAGITEEQPLQSFINYHVDLDQGSAHYFTTDGEPDSWSAQYMDKLGEDKFLLAPWRDRELWQGEAPMQELDTASIEILSDTTMSGKRYVKFKVLPGENTLSYDFLFAPHILVYNLEDREINLAKGRFGPPFLRYHAVPEKGLQMEVRLDEDKELSFELMERKLGMDPDLLPQAMPAELIHGPGYHSNTMQVKRTIIL